MNWFQAEMISSILQTKNKWSFQTLEHTPSLEKRLKKKALQKNAFYDIEFEQ